MAPGDEAGQSAQRYVAVDDGRIRGKPLRNRHRAVTLGAKVSHLAGTMSIVLLRENFIAADRSCGKVSDLQLNQQKPLDWKILNH